MGGFRDFLAQRQTGRDDEELSFRRRSKLGSVDDKNDDESPSYEVQEEVEEPSKIRVDKEGKELLFHNMVCSGFAAVGKEIWRFFKRMVQ